MAMMGGFLTSVLSGYLQKKRFGRQGVNVGRNERAVSGLVGVALTMLAMRRRGGRLGRLLGMFVGGALAKRSLTGKCGVYRRYGVTSA